MGGRGTAAARNGGSEAYKAVVEPEKGLVGGKATDKSHRIFIRSWLETENLWKRFAEDRDNFMLSDFYGYDSEKTLLSSQVYRGIQADINRRLRDADIDLKLGVIDQEEYKKDKQILNALQKTLNRRWQIHKSI